MQEPEWQLATPPGVGPVKSKPILLWILMIVVLVGTTIAAFVVPLPMFYAYKPGPVKDIEALVEVSDAPTYSSEGKLYMTTVNLDASVTFSEWVGSAFSGGETQIVPKEQIIGDGSLEDEIEQQRAEMRDSKTHAQEVAFAALGLGRPTGDGALVVNTLDGYPANGVLERDDVIVAIDGSPIETTCDVGRAIDSHGVGEEVNLTVKRDGVRETISLQTVPNPDDPNSSFLGIAMDDVNYEFEPGVSVRFDTGEIAGPSAGLMMSLALYDQLTPEDLTDGRRIAGTGTIQCDGGVGPIGGIQQKVAGAEQEGAEVFLAPEGNAADAREVADDIEIIAISTFDEALEYLEGLRG